MYGNKGRGNFNQKDKKPEDQKARTYSFRLNPEYPDEKWLIDEIERIGKNKLRLELPKWAKAYGNYTSEPPPDEYYASMLQEMKSLLFHIATKIEEGVAAPLRVEDVPLPKLGKQKKTQFSEKTIDTLMNFMNDGISYDEDSDE